jgi:molecular chaperone HtpG
MKEGQKVIYYLTGPSLKSLRASPHLEVFRRKGIEVLLMADAVDEWVVGSLHNFDGRALESVAHGQVELGDIPDNEAEQSGKANEENGDASDVEGCLAKVQQILGDRVKEVRASARLTDSASCLVSDEGDVSPQMERVMRMLDREIATPKRILEVNAKHPFVRNLAALVKARPEADEVRMFSELLLDQAMLAEGVVPDPSSLMQRMQQVMTTASARVVGKDG